MGEEIVARKRWDYRDIAIEDLADENAALRFTVDELRADNGILREILSEALTQLHAYRQRDERQQAQLKDQRTQIADLLGLGADRRSLDYTEAA